MVTSYTALNVFRPSCEQGRSVRTAVHSAQKGREKQYGCSLRTNLQDELGPSEPGGEQVVQVRVPLSSCELLRICVATNTGQYNSQRAATGAQCPDRSRGVHTPN